jgi:hypothetical protein
LILRLSAMTHCQNIWMRFLRSLPLPLPLLFPFLLDIFRETFRFCFPVCLTLSLSLVVAIHVQAIRKTLAFQCDRCPHRPGAPWPPFHISSTLQDESKEDRQKMSDVACCYSNQSFKEAVLGMSIVVLSMTFLKPLKGKSSK